MPPWTILLGLFFVVTNAILCPRAGGTRKGFENLDAVTLDWETPSACEMRGCKYHHDKEECHFQDHLQSTNITTVHLIQSNHLDVGYTDKAVNVMNLYFDTYFPRAIKVGEELRKRGGEERLKWMTQTYLVSLFLDCPEGLGLHCPSVDAITQFKEAVAAGDITWQAFPHNAGVTRLCPLNSVLSVLTQ